MYLILGHKNEIIHISSTIGYQSNGNPLVDEGRLAIAEILVKEIQEVSEIPAEVQPMKYCYTDGEFTLNPNWTEPVREADLQEQIVSLEAQLTETQLALCEMYEAIAGKEAI